MTRTQARPVEQRIAGELGVAVRQVATAAEPLDGCATAPFLAERAVARPPVRCRRGREGARDRPRPGSIG